ncbi:MAG: hypothetical protein ABIK44_01200 [candidate division WOR-3 bacterium]
MMSSTRPEAGRPKTLRRAKKTSTTMQYVMFFAVALIVLVVVVVAVTGTRKRSAPKRESTGRPRSSAYDVEGGTVARRSRTVGRLSRERKVERSKKREERSSRTAERTREARTETRRTSSSRISGVSSSRREKGRVLVAIIEESGVRYALIGDRRAKSGDEIDGRKIVDIGKDNVQVQLSTNVYTVKLGQPLP